jgi:hypothetical protein
MLGSLQSINWESKGTTHFALFANLISEQSSRHFKSNTATGVYAFCLYDATLAASAVVPTTARSFSSCKYRVHVSQPILEISDTFKHINQLRQYWKSVQ